MLGPGPFGYQNGGVVNGPNPFQIDPATNLAPVQVRFVVGNGGVAYSPNSEANLYATYEFDPQIAKGDVDRLKGAFGAPLNLPGGLYAQIFMWNGNPNVDLDVESLTLTVEGLRP
jgi:hypothetical protein